MRCVYDIQGFAARVNKLANDAGAIAVSLVLSILLLSQRENDYLHSILVNLLPETFSATGRVSPPRLRTAGRRPGLLG
jgi:hypothetical protein